MSGCGRDGRRGPGPGAVALSQLCTRSLTARLGRPWSPARAPTPILLRKPSRVSCGRRERRASLSLNSRQFWGADPGRRASPPSGLVCGSIFAGIARYRAFRTGLLRVSNGSPAASMVWPWLWGAGDARHPVSALPGSSRGSVAVSDPPRALMFPACCHVGPRGAGRRRRRCGLESVTLATRGPGRSVEEVVPEGVWEQARGRRRAPGRNGARVPVLHRAAAAPGAGRRSAVGAGGCARTQTPSAP